MVTKKRRNHSPGFKAKVAMAAVGTHKSLVEIAREYDVHPNQIHKWKKQLLNEAEHLFESRAQRGCCDSYRRVQELHAKIGELTMERDSLCRALGRGR